MDAPKKIYLQVCGDCPQTDCDNCKFSDLEDNVTWCKDRIFNKDIEYSRTDSFVEKAAEWLEENLSEYCDGEDVEYTPSSTYNVTILQNERLIEDFKKAMKQ